jgi:hypothetical protein
MYSTLPSFALGFHGCDESIGLKILAGNDRLKPSKNTYDWLGYGIYFWENNPQRALEFAEELKKKPQKGHQKISNPFVIGAIIDLGHCFNLLDSKYLNVLKTGFDALKNISDMADYPMPKNSKDNLRRQLDCAVIEMVHSLRETANEKPFDSVRSVNIEGKPIYPGTKIYNKNHIQICVRDPNCIKGYFRPLNKI